MWLPVNLNAFSSIQWCDFLVESCSPGCFGLQQNCVLCSIIVNKSLGILVETAAKFLLQFYPYRERNTVKCVIINKMFLKYYYLKFQSLLRPSLLEQEVGKVVFCYLSVL